MTTQPSHVGVDPSDVTTGPITVVVATRDRPNLLSGCLEALTETLEDDDEIVVVDSASTVSGVESVARRFGASVVRLEEPGLSRARNAGWRVASCELVAFVDDDVRVDPTWADAIRNAFSDHPAIDFLTGRVGVPSDQADRDRPVAVFDEDAARSIDLDVVGSWGHGANMAVRREALERLAGFDEALGAGSRFPSAEDYDLFDRMLADGSTGRYEPRVQAFHEQWRTRGQLAKLDYRYGKGAGARVSKLLRCRGDRPVVRAARRRAREVAGAYLWRLGARQVWTSLREGYEFGALFALGKISGFCVGFGWAWLAPVRGGHLDTRRVMLARPSSDGER